MGIRLTLRLLGVSLIVAIILIGTMPTLLATSPWGWLDKLCPCNGALHFTIWSRHQWMTAGMGAAFVLALTLVRGK